MADPEILFERNHNAGVVTINRPAALNAVTHSMVQKLQRQLLEWEHDPAVRHIVIKAAEGRAFSAGGDIRDLYKRGMKGRPHLQFFWDEYRLNEYIKAYPKPYIALIDGIVMGGGVGISFHGSHRVAGDDISFAMPEVGIGFFPDVGGSYFLSRLPGETGMYLALTGNRIKKDDCLWAGLVTHYCASGDIAALEEALCRADDAEDVLDLPVSNGSTGSLEAGKDLIDNSFSETSIGEILLNLDKIAGENAKESADWAFAAAKTIRSKSPTSLHIACRQLRAGKALSMAECMQMEYRIVSRVLVGGDFYEGIRAAIIDKDGAPHWQPGEIDAVDPGAISAIFAELQGTADTLQGELAFN